MFVTPATAQHIQYVQHLKIALALIAVTVVVFSREVIRAVLAIAAVALLLIIGLGAVLLLQGMHL